MAAAAADVGGGVEVSEFDYSADSHLQAIESISRVCGEVEIGDLDDDEIQQIASSITFLKEWKFYTYEPRDVKFCQETESFGNGNATGVVNLPQFSSASVPKDTLSASTSDSSVNASKDFILYAGGPVWGLDWCPRIRQNSECSVNCEFLAIAAHPPGSSYHMLGATLIGKGVIQIWCVLNRKSNDDLGDFSGEQVHTKVAKGRPKKIQKTKPQNDEHHKAEDTLPKRPKGRPRKQLIDKTNEQNIPKPRGRPRKKQAEEFLMDMENSNEHIQYVPAEVPGNLTLCPIDTFVEEVSACAVDVVNNAKKHSLKSSKRQRTRNKLHTESVNPVVTPDSMSLHESSSVAISTEQSPQPVALSEGLLEQSTSTNVLDVSERMPTMWHGNGSGCGGDYSLTDGSPTFSNWDQPVKKSTEPIVYVRRQKMTRTENLYDKRSVESCTTQPEQSMSHLHDRDCNVREDLGTDIKDSQVRQHEDSIEELPAYSLGDQFDVDNIYPSARRMDLSGEDDSSLPSFTQDVDYLSTDNVELGLVPSHYTNSKELVMSSVDPIIPQGVALPRLVLGLAHNGKVAWDVKWRPIVHRSQCKSRMGYLAVLLGNGSLEVWDVPQPHIACGIFSSSRAEGTDPRFMKLSPVFKCSKLKFQGRDSIPLTLEWSASTPHDMLLAGCHDGTVALWKFSEEISCKDTRPLLCLRADTAPIRAVSWAPVENDREGANVILTAGHGGLKLWDIRDPFHPLWVLPAIRIYSLDWMQNPGCVVLSSDDGCLKLLSIKEASFDVPVTGKPLGGSKLQGLHTYGLSSFAVWNVHVSRVTGMAAYCCADGSVVRFQVTRKGVEKDHQRNRTPHVLFSSVTVNDSVLTVHTHLPNTPFQMKKPSVASPSMRALLNAGDRSRVHNLQPKEPAADGTLALWNGIDSRKDLGTTAPLPIASTKTKQTTKPIPNPKSVDRESPQDDLATVCRVDNSESLKEETPAKPEVKADGPPPKIIAMHRVRWNMNEGSGRWLCSGGAAGLVRCQEMVLTDIDQKYYSKR